MSFALERIDRDTYTDPDGIMWNYPLQVMKCQNCGLDQHLTKMRERRLYSIQERYSRPEKKQLTTVKTLVVLIQ